jgi:hypothetical protein
MNPFRLFIVRSRIKANRLPRTLWLHIGSGPVGESADNFRVPDNSLETSGKGYAGRKMRLWDARYARHIGDEGSLRHTDLASSRRECRNSS